MEQRWEAKEACMNMHVSLVCVLFSGEDTALRKKHTRKVTTKVGNVVALSPEAKKKLEIRKTQISRETHFASNQWHPRKHLITNIKPTNRVA